MATFSKFNSFVEHLAEKVHNLGTDSLKLMLTNTAPVATNTVLADLVDLSTGGGYTAGGAAVTVASSAQTSGTYKLVINDVVFTATTGFGPFRYAVLYNDTPTSPADPLIGWWDYGSALTLGAAETFTADADAGTGVLTVA